MTILSAINWILIIVLGGLSGALGQSARVIVGIKKLDDQASLEGKSRDELFDLKRFILSIGIGFTAGALAALSSTPNPANVTMDQILAFMAAGYAGSDFIEGIMSRVLPASQTKSDSKNKSDVQAAIQSTTDKGTVG